MQGTDRRIGQRLILASNRAKATLSTIAVLVDDYCRRLNGGLTAVALVLALILLATIAVRGEEQIAAAAIAAENGLPAAGWAY